MFRWEGDFEPFASRARISTYGNNCSRRIQFVLQTHMQCQEKCTCTLNTDGAKRRKWRLGWSINTCGVTQPCIRRGAPGFVYFKQHCRERRGRDSNGYKGCIWFQNVMHTCAFMSTGFTVLDLLLDIQGRACNADRLTKPLYVSESFHELSETEIIPNPTICT